MTDPRNSPDAIPSDPVLTCAAAKAWEAGVLADPAAEWHAMQQAGAALAASLLDDYQELGGFPSAGRVLVLAGKGNNGGDALLAARAIAERYPGTTWDVLFGFGEAAVRPLARQALEALRQVTGDRLRTPTLAALKSDFADYALCLDGIFGFQFRLPLDGVIAELLAWVNTHPRLALRAAVDLPSGLGETNAGTVFRADFTYATGIVKAPVMLPANAVFVGRLRYLDLGFFAGGRVEPPAVERILRPTVLAPLARLRPSQSDKRTYGHLALVGGSHRFPGAVVLAARAALRSGVGLVTAFVPERLAAAYAAAHPEVMWVGCPETADGSLAIGAAEGIRHQSARATALLMGPGLGADPETMALVTRLAAASAVPLVLDADALRPEVLSGILDRPFIGTPHAGEYRRIQPVLYAGGQWAAPKATVVLKGPLTRVTDGHTTYCSLFGGPVLARGGSGDLLAGLIGGLLAQEPQALELAACRGVVWHGLAADFLARTGGQVAVETAQLLEQLGPALHSVTCQNH